MLRPSSIRRLVKANRITSVSAQSTLFASTTWFIVDLCCLPQREQVGLGSLSVFLVLVLLEMLTAQDAVTASQLRWKDGRIQLLELLPEILAPTSWIPG